MNSALKIQCHIVKNTLLFAHWITTLYRKLNLYPTYTHGIGILPYLSVISGHVRLPFLFQHHTRDEIAEITNTGCQKNYDRFELYKLVQPTMSLCYQKSTKLKRNYKFDYILIKSNQLSRPLICYKLEVY